MRKVRYGIIGFGGIAERRVAKEGYACDRKRFASLPNAELVAATDINPARFEAATALGLRFHASADELLACDDIDAVYIATNNASHASNAIAALKAGKHVIVEKPLTTKLADAKKIVSLGKKLGLSVSVDHMMVNNAYNELAKRYVHDGKLGKVNDCRIHMADGCGLDEKFLGTWRCSRIDEMGGPIGDLAAHCFYVAEFLFDSKICGISAIYHPKRSKMIAEDGAHILATLENGIVVEIDVSFCEPRGGSFLGAVSDLGFEIYGDKGIVRTFGTMFQLSGHSDEPVPIRMEFETEDGVKFPKPRKFSNIYQRIIEEHAKSILSGRPMSPQGGVDVVEYCIAAHKSAQSGGKYVKVGVR